MGKVIEPTFADTYGSVAMISAYWVIMAYAFMPLGPLAGLKKCSTGHKRWCVYRQEAVLRAHIHADDLSPVRAQGRPLLPEHGTGPVRTQPDPG